MIALFCGPDELARTEAVQALRATLPAEMADLNTTTLDGRRLKLDVLKNACEAFPFLADKRLVIVHDLLKHQKAGKDREELRTYLERLPATCDLLFVESEEVDRRSAVFTLIKKQGAIHEFAVREGADLQRWITARARQHGATIEPAAAQRLVALAGSEGRALDSELQKLVSYVGGGGRIGVAEVDLLTQDATEQNLFAFIDDLAARRRGPAMLALRRLIDDGQAPIYLIFMIARQVRILLAVKELTAQRLRPDDIATRLGQKPFVVRKALDQARGFSEAEILALHARLVALDHAGKTGRADLEAGLELLVAEVAG